MTSAAIKRIGIPCCLITSILFVVLGVFLLAFGNAGVENIIESQLPILPEHHLTYDNWRNIPIPIYNHFYLFNITNAEAVLAQTEKPHVAEVGPFVFKEHREKVNITYNADSTLVDYETVHRYEFVPEMSNGSMDDSIYHLNVPLAAASVYVSKQPPDSQEFLYYAINQLINDSAAILFPVHTVSELLFEGYSDELITEGAQILPGQASMDKFGWFYKRNNSVSDGVYQVFTGVGDIQKLGRMSTWKNSTTIVGFNDSCGVISDSSPGDFQPPFEATPPPSVKLFVGDMCRTLKLDFVSEVVSDGIRTNRYAMPPTAFDYDLKENQCYCPEGICPVSGVANVSTCQLGAPAFVSLPHFLYADQTYLDAIDGLHPDPEKHGFRMDVFPVLGVAVNLKVTMQINVMLVKDPNIDVLANMTTGQILYPEIWFYSTANSDGGMNKQLKEVQMIPQLVLWVSMAITIVSLSTLLASALCYRRERSRRLHPAESRERLVVNGEKPPSNLS